MSKDILKAYEKLSNIAEELDDDQLQEISNTVLEGFQRDLTSMSEWHRQVDDAIKLASLLKEPKDTPYPNSANIKYPLITDACFQFAANTYPDIVQDGKVVKAAVLGKDNSNVKQDQARRVADFMSYQMLFQSTEWEKGLDKLLNMLPNIGFLCKRTYYDPIKKENCSELCDPKDLILNSKITSLNTARRVTNILHFHTNDLLEYSRKGLFLQSSVDEILEYYKGSNSDGVVDCLEQHGFLDLDDDEYEEPYVITIERNTGKMLRIYARFDADDVEVNKDGKVSMIKPIQYFTDFHFLPNPNGSFLSIGFGTLMSHLNETINTILNQLIDAGGLRNMQGGYINSKLKLPSGASRHKPGEWQRVKPVSGEALKDGFFPIQYQEPSSVLFSLLGMLVQAGKELSSSTEAMQGSSMPDNAKTGAVNALIDRGMKVFNSIRRRVLRSMKDEYMKWFYLNYKYMDEKEYRIVMDDKEAVFRIDFDIKTIDIMPIADPNMSSDLQRVQQIQILQGIIAHPNVNIREIDIRTLEFARIPNPEKILPLPDQKAPPPPEAVKMQADITQMAADASRKDREMSLRERQFVLDCIRTEQDLEKVKSEAIKNLALAEAADKSIQIQDYQTQLSMLDSKMSTIMQIKQLEQAQGQHEDKMAQVNPQNQEGQNAEPPGNAQPMAPAPNDAAPPQDIAGAPPGQL